MTTLIELFEQILTITFIVIGLFLVLCSIGVVILCIYSIWIRTQASNRKKIDVAKII